MYTVPLYCLQSDEEQVEIPPKILVYPASMIGRSDIDSGDKMILSPDILMACEQKELSYPMVCTV